MRGKDNWDVFGKALASAAAKALTAEQFAKEIGEDVENVRADYQSYLLKIATKVETAAEAKYDSAVASGVNVTKTKEVFVKEAVAKNQAAYRLKSAKGRKATDLDIEMDLDLDL